VSSALSSPTSNLLTHVDGFIDAVRSLRDDFHITVEHAPLPRHEVSAFDGDRRTIVLRPDATLEEQLWALREWWDFIVFGASPHAHRKASLRLVPQPRAAGD